MTRVAVYAAGLGLSGLEFAHGIPGTVGGGVYMNAGAYGGEISQVCTCVETMNMQGEIISYTADEMEFAYRHSRVAEQATVRHVEPDHRRVGVGAEHTVGGLGSMI